MPISYDTFERLKDRGLAAFKSGDHKAAKPYLMQAADAIIKIVAETDRPAQRNRRKAMAARYSIKVGGGLLLFGPPFSRRAPPWTTI